MGSVKNAPRSTLMVLLAAGLFVTCASAASAAEKAGSKPSEIHRNKSVKNYAEQDKTLEKARKLLSEEKYAEAVEAFENVLAVLELEISEVNGAIARARHAQVKSEIFNARRAWGKSLMQLARVAAAEKRYDDAMRLASEAAARDTLLKEESERLLTFCHGMIRNDKLESDRGIKKYENEIKAKADRIKTLLAEARTLYKAKDYMGAIAKCESVYLIDPINMEAVELAGRIWRRVYAYADKRNETSSARAIAVTEWQWIEPVFEVTGQEKSDDAVAHNTSDVSGAEKLDKIIFPTFQFDEGDLPSIIEFLQSRSKQYDPEKVGVVIENNLPPGADQVTLTMSLSNVPLSTVLRVLCLKASEWSDIFRDGIKYTVSDNGRRVTLSSAAAQVGMEERIFSVPDILFRMVQGEGGSVAPVEAAPAAESTDAPPSEDGEAAAAPVEAAPAAVGSAGRAIPAGKWIACFKNWLIPFPEGSSVFHDAVRGEITVRNTPENLRLLDVVLGQISSLVDPLVMIEIKAIEISESDYQELGFDWAIANTGVVDRNTGVPVNENAILADTKGKHSSWLLTQGINTLVGGALSPTRSMSTPIVKDWNIFSSLFGTQTPFGSQIPFTVNLTINALCQNNRTETVSAPKIVVKATPGKGDDNAGVVAMGKSYYFPESWDEIEVDIEGGGSDSSPTLRITPPQPDFGDSTFVGMNFNVKPRLLSDNKTLEVKLKVNASSYAVLEGSEEMPEDKWNIHVVGRDERNQPFDMVFPIFQPRFYKRDLDIVTNIYDGDTIVVGGMVEAQTQATNDKIPFLGDLPLVGRLFQSSSETVKRTNMLIFLSARLMKNDGTPLNVGKPTGLPDFNR